MVKKMEKSNLRVRTLINSFDNAKKGKAFFKRLSGYLKKPSRKATEVNVAKLDKISKSGEALVVPGKVLGFGEVKKKINVYAIGFSGQAREKIEKAGGKCMTLEELVKGGKTARIIL